VASPCRRGGGARTRATTSPCRAPPPPPPSVGACLGRRGRGRSRRGRLQLSSGWRVWVRRGVIPYFPAWWRLRRPWPPMPRAVSHRVPPGLVGARCSHRACPAALDPRPRLSLSTCDRHCRHRVPPGAYVCLFPVQQSGHLPPVTPSPVMPSPVPVVSAAAVAPPPSSSCISLLSVGVSRSPHKTSGVRFWVAACAGRWGSGNRGPCWVFVQRRGDPRFPAPAVC